jgi:hypothetical protein
MPSCGLLCRMALVRLNVSEERIASIIKVTRISKLVTTLAVTSNWSTLRKKILCEVKRYVLTKQRFLQESHGVTSQNMAFFKVTEVCCIIRVSVYISVCENSKMKIFRSSIPVIPHITRIRSCRSRSSLLRRGRLPTFQQLLGIYLYPQIIL